MTPEELAAARETDIAAAQKAVRAFRAREWEEKQKRKKAAKIAKPSDKDLNWPESMISVYWETGYITIAASAFYKLPKAVQNKISKLGGL